MTKHKRTLIIGDVHGCYDELELLIQKMDFDPIDDDLIFVGDVINRGPKSLDVLKFIASHKCRVIKGNHEIAFIRYAKSGIIKKDSSFNTILNEMGDEKEKWLEWIDSWPLFIEEENFIVVHGGLCPGFHPKNTSADILTRIRTWDGKGENLNNLSNPPWDHFYHGEKLIVFGHWSQRGLVVKENIIGLDSGCVWGGSLTGVELPQRKIYQVKAKKAYRSV